MIIAIDGPAASGKTTVAKGIATRLGYYYLGTGAMYRAVTLWALDKKVDIFDEKGLASFVRGLNISFSKANSKDISQQRVFVNKVDVTERLGAANVNRKVSYVAKVSEVRKVLVAKQRKLASRNNVVAEGRDIGTAVFPEADVKIFLTATSKERAKRRQNELGREGHFQSLDSLHRELISRDKIDSNRSTSPLTRAPDAYLIDTTNKSVEKIVEEVLKLIKLVKKEKCNRVIE